MKNKVISTEGDQLRAKPKYDLEKFARINAKVNERKAIEARKNEQLRNISNG